MTGVGPVCVLRAKAQLSSALQRCMASPEAPPRWKRTKGKAAARPRKLGSRLSGGLAELEPLSWRSEACALPRSPQPALRLQQGPCPGLMFGRAAQWAAAPTS